MNVTDMEQAAQAAAGLLKAIGNPGRLLILCHLAEGERSVGELQELIGLRQSALSQQLARLRRDGLVRTRREARSIHYAINGDEARQIIGVLHKIYCEPDPSSAHLEEKTS